MPEEAKPHVPLPKAGHEVKRWLEEEGFTVRPLPEPSLNFFFGLKAPSGLLLNAFQPKGKSDVVLFGGSLDLTEEDKNRLNAIPAEKRARFFWDLRIVLLQGEFSFSLKPDAEQLEQVLVTESIWGAELDKAKVMRAVQHVTNGIFLAIAFFAREFGYSS